MGRLLHPGGRGIGDDIVRNAADNVVTKTTSKVSTESTTKVFRVFGGDAKPNGFSYTTTNPNSVTNFRNVAGLPSGGASGSTNTGQFVIEGTVNSTDIIKTRAALPLDGNVGGLPELIIDPSKVKIDRVSGANPDF